MLKITGVFIWLMLSAVSLQGQRQREYLYVGTYAVRGSEGIYVYEFDREKNLFTLVQTVKTPESPTFIAVHPSGKFLYAVNRGSIPEKPNHGSVSAFRIDPLTGQLTGINHRTSFGRDPCHISTDRSGKLAFVCNYNGGNIVVFPIGSDGTLGPCTDSVAFSGSSVHPSRQEGPHPHSSFASPDNRFLLVADLGTDRVYSFSINSRDQKITPGKKPFVTVAAGAGPRHFTFHPAAKYLYLAEELTSTVAVFSYAIKSGELKLVKDRVKSLPDDFGGSNTAADIHTDAKGKYLFMSNRGHQSVAVFDIVNERNPVLKSTIPVAGEKPRNFLVDADNEFLLVANQDTDNIVMFLFDEKNGTLKETAVEIKTPSPVCLKMLKIK